MKGKITWMNKSGDTLATFDTELETSTDGVLTVKDAEEFLAGHRAKHRIIHNVRDKTIAEEFDPTADHWVITPQMGGGC